MPMATFRETVQDARDSDTSQNGKSITLAEALILAKQDYLTLSECQAILQVFAKHLKNEKVAVLVAQVKGKSDNIGFALATEDANAEFVK